MTASTLSLPGVRGKSRKLYVIVPSRTPLTTESIPAPSAAHTGVAATIFTTSRLETIAIPLLVV